MSGYRNAWSVVALATAVFACADLQRIPSGVCGNGVVESGEDCDRFSDPNRGDNLTCGQVTDAPAVQCRYLCSDGVSQCPRGWACNVDGVCHHGSRTFQEAPNSPLPLPAETIGLADVDSDSSLDLIGFSDSEVTVRFGAGNAQFPTEFLFATLPQQGPPAAGLFNTPMQDPRNADYAALIPLDFGLMVLRGQTDQSMMPVPSIAETPPDLPDANRVVQVPLPRPDPFSPPRTGQLFLFRGPDGFKFQLGAGPVADLSATAMRHNLANLAAVPVGDLDSDADNGSDLALAFDGDNRVFAIGIVGGPMGVAPTERDAVSLAGLPSGTAVANPTADDPGDGNPLVTSRVVFARVDRNNTTDMLISVADSGGERRVALATGQGNGTFVDPAGFENRFDPLRQDCLDSGGEQTECPRFPVAAGDFTGDGVADYVASHAVYVTNPSDQLTMTSKRQSSSPWIEAAIADFNGDGAADVAAASADERSIEFLLGDNSGFFTPVTITTEGIPFSLRAGDFDGNQVLDLAFAEDLGAVHAASIAFGESFAPPDRPTRIGFFGRARIGYCETARLEDPADLTDDLAIVMNGELISEEPGNTRLSLFAGTAQRRLVSPLVFFIDPGDNLSVDAALLGRFLAIDSSNQADVAVFTGFNSTPPAPRLWLLDRPNEGDSPRPTDRVTITGDDLTGFDFPCARWLSGDVNGDGRDEILAVDRTDRCYEPGQAAASPQLLIIESVGMPPMARATIRPLLGGLTVPRQLTLAELDGDDGVELIIAYAGAYEDSECTPMDPAATSNAGVIVYRDATNLDDHVTVANLPSTAIPAVATLNADGDPDLELAIWHGSAVSLADSESAGAFAVQVTGSQSSSPACDGQILAGDIDGDGLDDLLLSGGGQVELRLAVPHTAVDTVAPTNQ
ncbi:MAG: FG-GAP-like repeat-containing protein [Proteobacteria bacterium]|nr:FG-GAP-like repeat-containing protein [Pseudomonadota bacterium]